MKHNWLLQVSKCAQQDVDKLPTKRDLMAVLEAIRQLLEADNPSRVAGVAALERPFFGADWRQRQGDWRIFFSFETQEIIPMKCTYKGTLYLLAVVHRKDAYN